MRTLIFIFTGIIVYGLIAWITNSFSNNSHSRNPVTIIFIACWFLVSAVNMWIIISKTRLSFIEELPDFLLVFLIPGLFALLIQWAFFQKKNRK